METLDRIKRKQRIFAFVILCASLFFWVWAILNTVKMETGYDLGIVSFLSTAISSAYLLWRTRPGIIPIGKCAQVLVLLTHLFVAANYAIGTMFAFKWLEPVKVGFGIYCAIFIVVWLVVGVIGYLLIEAERRTVGEKEPAVGEGSTLMENTGGSVV